MKLEIYLNDIIGDDYGSETLQESIRRQVVESLTKTIKEGIGKKIDVEVAKVINEEIKENIKTQMPKIVDDLINSEYTMIDQWGSVKGKTTFRQELLNSIQGQLKYEKKQWDSDKNVFTKAVEAVIGENVKAFQVEFNKTIDTQFINEAMSYATNKLRERLGVK